MSTFTPYRGRTLEEGQVVEVFYNLREAKWSVRDKATRLVLGHADNVTLANCEFKVSDKGRERVRREKQKHVHAVVVGEFVESGKDEDFFYAATYNPYTHERFHLVMKPSGKFIREIHKANLVNFDSNRRVHVEA